MSCARLPELAFVALARRSAVLRVDPTIPLSTCMRLYSTRFSEGRQLVHRS